MEESKETNDRVNSLLLVNQLDYRLPPSLSVAVSRSHASYQSNQQSYGSGQLLSVTMSSGGQYVNFRESYIRFTVNVTAGDQRSWSLYDESWADGVVANPDPNNQAGNPPPGRNGVMNLFGTQRWVHASGTVIDEQIQDLDLWSYVRQRYGYSSDKRASIGSLQQYGVRSYDSNEFPVNTVTSRQFLLPLCEITDAFDQAQLCPAFIVAGSRLELRLNDFGRAFVATTGVKGDTFGLPSYTITGVELVLQQIQLTDSIQRALQNISASSGLEYPFTSIAVNANLNDSTSGSIQVSRSLSRANMVCVVRRNSDQFSGDSRYFLQSSAPSSEKIVTDVGGRISLQLGGQQIPQSPIQSEREAYWQSLVAFGAAYDSTRCPEVSFQDFAGLTVWNDQGGVAARPRYISDGVYGISLETSSTLNQSGSALSAQRVLVFINSPNNFNF